jgi:hypothetical protein
MSGHCLTHDRQAEPEAVTILPALYEWLEELLDIAGRKPSALVLDLDYRGVALAPRADADRRARLAELEPRC